LVGVEPCGRDEFGESVVDSDYPAGVVHHFVVGATQQDQVAEFAGAAVGPVCDVMGLAPFRGGGASRVGTATVSHGEGFALGAGCVAFLPAHVEGFAVAAE
jgi:hypothetical protein